MDQTNQIIKNNLNEIFKFLRMTPLVEIEKTDELYKVAITGDNLSFLIGSRGMALKALQHFMILAIYRETNAWVNLLLDINGYKKSRLEKVDELTKNFIDRVRFLEKEVAMPPMQAYERKRVHEFVADYSDVESLSSGEGRDRHVVLKPVKV